MDRRLGRGPCATDGRDRVSRHSGVNQVGKPCRNAWHFNPGLELPDGEITFDDPDVEAGQD